MQLKAKQKQRNDKQNVYEIVHENFGKWRIAIESYRMPTPIIQAHLVRDI